MLYNTKNMFLEVFWIKKVSKISIFVLKTANQPFPFLLISWEWIFFISITETVFFNGVKLKILEIPSHLNNKQFLATEDEEATRNTVSSLESDKNTWNWQSTNKNPLSMEPLYKKRWENKVFIFKFPNRDIL